MRCTGIGSTLSALPPRLGHRGGLRGSHMGPLSLVPAREQAYVDCSLVYREFEAMAAAADIPDHRAHCMPQLARLRMLAWHEPGEPFRPSLADEISQATSLVLAEAQAAWLAIAAAVAGSRRGAAVAGFLAPRLARLETTAAEAVGAAKDSDAAALRRHLSRFEALTSAMWTVQLAVAANAPSPPPGRHG